MDWAKQEEKVQLFVVGGCWMREDREVVFTCWSPSFPDNHQPQYHKIQFLNKSTYHYGHHQLMSFLFPLCSFPWISPIYIISPHQTNKPFCPSPSPVSSLRLNSIFDISFPLTNLLKTSTSERNNLYRREWIPYQLRQKAPIQRKRHKQGETPIHIACTKLPSCQRRPPLRIQSKRPISLHLSPQTTRKKSQQHSTQNLSEG